jgi:hypothetical protein
MCRDDNVVTVYAKMKAKLTTVMCAQSCMTHNVELHDRFTPKSNLRICTALQQQQLRKTVHASIPCMQSSFQQ